MKLLVHRLIVFQSFIKLFPFPIELLVGHVLPPSLQNLCTLSRPRLPLPEAPRDQPRRQLATRLIRRRAPRAVAQPEAAAHAMNTAAHRGRQRLIRIRLLSSPSPQICGLPPCVFTKCSGSGTLAARNRARGGSPQTRNPPGEAGCVGTKAGETKVSATRVFPASRARASRKPSFPAT